ncbi:MAG: hypothetical protein ACYC18_08550 [Gammaproteobacteria bacterium]
MMHALFVAVGLTGAAYFLLRERRFDFLTVGYFSSLVYFVPGFIGNVPDFSSANSWADLNDRIPLEAHTYAVMTGILTAVLVAAIIADILPDIRSPRFVLLGSESGADVGIGLSVLGFIATMVTTGSALWSSDKVYMLAHMGRWYLLFAWGAAVSLVIGVSTGRRLIPLIAVGLLVLGMYIGFRANLAIAMIALGTFWLNRKGKQRLLRDNLSGLLIAIPIGVLFFVYRAIGSLVKVGDWGQVLAQLASVEQYKSSLLLSEPFITQAILNKVIETGFYVGPGHFHNVLYAVGMFSDSFGARPTGFNTLFQPALFPSITQWGMANNIWAEMLASGGVVLLCVFILAYVLGLLAGSFFLRSGDRSVAALAALVGTLWAFYCHRNDLLNEINIIKQIIFVWLICVIPGMTFWVLGSGNRPRLADAGGCSGGV